MNGKLNKLDTISWLVGVSALILFGCSSLRHNLFQSAAWDLGIFDQAVYLISQGQHPISSFLGFHILGDHAAWILYPIALLYKIYPSVYWLFALQAVALAVCALLISHLARQAGLQARQTVVIAVVYLLYPLVFNVNLYDFHPETIALPALFGAILAVKREHIGWFCFNIILVLGCKAVLSLTIFAMGIWLLVYEKKKLFGAVALASGICWFIIACYSIIPTFGGDAAGIDRHISRYAHFGRSFWEIGQNLLLSPQLLLGKIFSVDTWEYLALLLIPVVWGLAPQCLFPLIGALPTLLLNILSGTDQQRNIVHQYSLPILPFLIVVAINSLAARQVWLKSSRWIILWALVAFLALAKYGYFWSIYLNSLDTWVATREAIALVKSQGSLYTTAEIAPHLTHRPLVQFTDANVPPGNLSEYDYILLNVRHPGWLSHREFVVNLVDQLNNTSSFQLRYQRDDVYLFVKQY